MTVILQCTQHNIYLLARALHNKTSARRLQIFAQRTCCLPIIKDVPPQIQFVCKLHNVTKGRAYQLSWVCIHKSSLFTTCRTFQSNLLTKYNGCTFSNLACSQTVQHCPSSLLTSYSWYTSTNLVCSQTAQHQQTACLPIFNNVLPQISMFTNCTTLKKLL